MYVLTTVKACGQCTLSCVSSCRFQRWCNMTTSLTSTCRHKKHSCVERLLAKLAGFSKSSNDRPSDASDLRNYYAHLRPFACWLVPCTQMWRPLSLARIFKLYISRTRKSVQPYTCCITYQQVCTAANAQKYGRGPPASVRHTQRTDLRHAVWSHINKFGSLLLPFPLALGSGSAAHSFASAASTCRIMTDHAKPRHVHHFATCCR